jgi:hypothetical protein
MEKTLAHKKWHNKLQEVKGKKQEWCKKNDTTNYKKQKQNDVVDKFIVVKNHFASCTFAKSANVMVETSKCMKKCEQFAKENENV